MAEGLTGEKDRRKIALISRLCRVADFQKLQ